MAKTFCRQEWDLQAAGCELLPHSEQKTKLISQYVLNLTKELRDRARFTRAIMIITTQG